MPVLYAPDPDTVRVNDIERNADGSFTIDDPALADHLVRFGWSYWPPAEQLPPLPPGLTELRKAELVALAEQRGLPTEGARADLIARLRAST